VAEMFLVARCDCELRAYFLSGACHGGVRDEALRPRRDLAACRRLRPIGGAVSSSAFSELKLARTAKCARRPTLIHDFCNSPGHLGASPDRRGKIG
jgi:hypothetical protein